VVQLLKDFLGVNEGLGSDAFVDMRYRALNCEIEEGDKSDSESLKELLKPELLRLVKSNSALKVNKIFRIGRRCESESFEHKVGNAQLLFHGTKGSRLVGISLVNIYLCEFL
jgi:Poly(ADP-ribose) polymerase catalytic domain